MENLIIDESNFHDYFFDIKKHGPKKGQILARYTAMADFVEGAAKSHMINAIVENPIGMETAKLLMKNELKATDEYVESIPLQIQEDIKLGMSIEDIKRKPYRFQIEYFYWVEKQYVPSDDVHWQIISITKDELNDDKD